MECMNGTCALFHACEAVSAAVLRRGNVVGDMADSQIKSRERVSKRGEVFTAKREVNAMLDLVKHETERLDSRFLEPACGTGNFLEEILLRKLDAATRASIPDGKKTPIPAKFERNSIVVLTSIYGVDLMFDNVAECRERLYEIWHKAYKKACRRSVSELVCDAAKVILSRNIIQGNSLSMKKVDDRQNDLEDPIVFSEWSFIGEYKVKRTDYRLDKMLAGKYKAKQDGAAKPANKCAVQSDLFDARDDATNDEGDIVSEFPILPHYARIAEYGG